MNEDDDEGKSLEGRYSCKTRKIIEGYGYAVTD